MPVLLEQSERKRVQGKVTRGNLDVIVLKVLSKQPMCGYALISTIRDIFGIYFGPSTMYKLLSFLEEKGYAEGCWDTHNLRPKKVYNITHKGEELLSVTEECLDHTLLMLRNMELVPSLKKATLPFP